jgi:hypothetical protein
VKGPDSLKNQGLTVEQPNCNIKDHWPPDGDGNPLEKILLNGYGVTIPMQKNSDESDSSNNEAD